MKEAARRARNAELLKVGLLGPFDPFVLASMARALWASDLNTRREIYQTREDARSLLRLDGAQVELRSPAHFAEILEAAEMKDAELKAASESGAKKKRKHTPSVSKRLCSFWPPFNRRTVPPPSQ